MNNTKSQDSDYINLQIDYKKEYDKLQTEYDKLQTEYNKLKTEHENLKNDYSQLKHEYSENTVIQSMNIMKIQYEELIESSVSKYKYEHIYEKWKYLNQVSNACKVILDHSLTFIEKICDSFIYGSQKRIEMQKLQSQLTLIKELLNDGI